MIRSGRLGCLVFISVPMIALGIVIVTSNNRVLVYGCIAAVLILLQQAASMLARAGGSEKGNVADLDFGSRPDKEQELFPNDPWRDVPDGKVHDIRDGVLFQARGRVFHVKESGQGYKVAREIDPKTGKYTAPGWTRGSGRDVKGMDHSLAEYLKYKINTKS